MLNRGSTYDNWLQNSVRVKTAGSTYIYTDIEEFGYRLFGWKLVGNSPPGFAPYDSKGLLVVEGVYFDNYAVRLVWQVMSL